MKTKHTSRSKQSASTATEGNVPPVPPAASIPAPPPQTSHRQLNLHCYVSDGKEHHYGALKSIRSVFNSIQGLVEIRATSEDYCFAKLSLDHAQTRGILQGLNAGLTVLARLRGYKPCTAELEKLRQFNVSRFKSPDQSPAHIEVRALPWREIILLSAHSSVDGLFCLIRLYLTTLEAEALTYDMERSLRDMEQFTDI